MSKSSRAVASLVAALLCVLVTAAGPLAAQAAPDYTAADVAFMQGMIIHHAQAVVMSDWAPTHGASSQVAVLCKRIALSQRDEITMMQDWLRQHHLAAPDPLHMLDAKPSPVVDRSSMHMPGMDMGDHPMVMAGMLTPEEMRQLDASHGTAFDRLYLTGMIKHHQGALDMVAALFATPRGGQQSEIFNFASEIDAGQRAQMGRMDILLAQLKAKR